MGYFVTLAFVSDGVWLGELEDDARWSLCGGFASPEKETKRGSSESRGM